MKGVSNVKIEIEELKKVKLNKGDVIIITLPKNDDLDIAMELQIMEKIFPNNKVLIKNKEVDFEIIEGEPQ